MPWMGFEPTISAGERPKTYALDRAATGTGTTCKILDVEIYIKTFLYSHSHAYRSVQTVIRESVLSLAKVTFVDTVSKITSL